jgi:hypothetical protein
VAESETVIEFVVALLFQSKDPVKAPAVNKELPQILVTVTVGAVGMDLGAARPPRVSIRGLVQPFTVCVTV